MAVDVSILRNKGELVFSKLKKIIDFRNVFFGKKCDFSVGTTNKKMRDDWLERTLKKIPYGSRILDAGAGELRYKNLCGHLDYVSQDFAKYDGSGDSSGLQTGSWDSTKLDIVSDITAIPEPDKSFDAVMCVEVFEHIPSPTIAFKELVRILKLGGKLIITAPFCALTHFSPYFFHTGFSEYFYRYWAEEYGLNILDLQKNGNYFEYLAQELRRLPSIGKKYAGKSPEYWEMKAINAILPLLQELSGRDKGSEELLCYELCFLAEKKN